MFTENYYMQPYDFHITVTCNETATREVWIWIPACFQLFLHVKEKATPCRQNIVTFHHNIAYMVNSFVFTLDIPVMFEIVHDKLLNIMYLYWFHNDISNKNNSLNGHSNEPWIING